MKHDSIDCRRIPYGQDRAGPETAGKIPCCYIPFDWKKDFEEECLKEIRYLCLVMSKSYIEERFADIRAFANVIEERLDDEYCTMENVLEENAHNLEMCRKYGCDYHLIDGSYDVSFAL